MEVKNGSSLFVLLKGLPSLIHAIVCENLREDICVSVRVTIAMVKHHDQKQGDEEMVYLAYTFIS